MFWNVIVLLLRLRLRLAARNLMQSASAVSTVAFGLFVLVPVAAFAGKYCYTALPLSSAQAALLSFVLLILQGAWLLLLVPGIGISLGRSLPVSARRAFPLRPFQVVIAALLSSLLELTSLLVLPVFVAITARFGGHALLKSMAVLALLALFSLQTVALWQLLEQGWAAVSQAKRLRTPFLVALALFSFFLFRGLPAALAATPSSPGASLALRAINLSGTQFLPSGIASGGIVAASQGNIAESAGAAALLAAIAAGFLALADRLRIVSEKSGPASGGFVLPLPLAPGFSHSGLSQAAAVAGAELRCLLREPAAHLPLRSPALLLLICYVAWIAPNLGNDPFANLRDLLGMVGLLYALVWQAQLLCNRFGNEAGRAAMLFHFPTPRRYLLMGRNAALLLLLLPLDSAIVVYGCLAAHAPERIAAILWWGACALITFTAFGNLVSARLPFPIRRQGERFQAEPERSIAFLYLLIGFATFALLWSFSSLVAWVTWPIAAPLCVLAIGTLYAGSVLAAEQMVRQNERRLTYILDRE